MSFKTTISLPASSFATIAGDWNREKPFLSIDTISPNGFASMVVPAPKKVPVANNS